MRYLTIMMLFMLFTMIIANDSGHCEIVCPKVKQACSIHCVALNMTAKCVCSETAAHCICIKSEIVGCSAAGEACSSAGDCCFSCSGADGCFGGICQQPTCLGSGAPCLYDCSCCSQNCDVSTVDEGTCI